VFGGGKSNWPTRGPGGQALVQGPDNENPPPHGTNELGHGE